MHRTQSLGSGGKKVMSLKPFYAPIVRPRFQTTNVNSQAKNTVLSNEIFDQNPVISAPFSISQRKVYS